MRMTAKGQVQCYQVFGMEPLANASLDFGHEGRRLQAFWLR